MRLAILLAILLGTGRAHAGDFCGDVKDELKSLEDSAKIRAKEHFGSWTACLDADRADKDRIVKACTKILDDIPDDLGCNMLVASVGATTAGKHDVFAFIAKQFTAKDNARQAEPAWALGSFQDMADPRAAVLIVERWKNLIPVMARYEKIHHVMEEWSAWRQASAAALAATGDKDDATFLVEQAGLTKDVHVREACTAGAAQIQNRLNEAASR
jgi:hypothetical protein